MIVRPGMTARHGGRRLLRSGDDVASPTLGRRSQHRPASTCQLRDVLARAPARGSMRDSSSRAGCTPRSWARRSSYCQAARCPRRTADRSLRPGRRTGHDVRGDRQARGSVDAVARTAPGRSSDAAARDGDTTSWLRGPDLAGGPTKHCDGRQVRAASRPVAPVGRGLDVASGRDQSGSMVTRRPRAASCSWKCSARSFGARATTEAPVVWISQAC